MLAFFGISGTSAQAYQWNLAEMPAHDIELRVEYYTDLLETEDNSGWLATNSGVTASVWLGRTLQPGSYNSFALPFDMAIPEGWLVKELDESSFDSTTGELTLKFATVTSTIKAGKPYLVMITGSEAITLTGYNDVTIGNATPSTTTAAVNFIPTLGKTLVTGPAGDVDNAKAVLYLGASNKLYRPTKVNDGNDQNCYMKGYRAYFQLKDDAATEARTFNIDFGDSETTGIMLIDILPSDTYQKDDNTYTLDGRRINGQPTMKGVYVKNGKKIVIK